MEELYKNVRKGRREVECEGICFNCSVLWSVILVLVVGCRSRFSFGEEDLGIRLMEG